jgi:hypothetical protein
LLEAAMQTTLTVEQETLTAVQETVLATQTEEKY